MNLLADFMICLYKANRKTFRLRGGYRILTLASRFLPKLRHLPISFKSTGKHYADIQKPDTYWLLNAYLGDAHTSICHLNKLLTERSNPGAVIWDIGGSMGLFTIGMLNASPYLKSIHLFEPNPIPRKIAIDLLGHHPKVQIYPFALGDIEAIGTLCNGEEAKGTGGGSLLRLAGKREGLEVEIKVGDSLVTSGNIPSPDIIKIDVEGYEISVLRGMKDIIANKKPIIAMEILFLTQDQINENIPEGYRIRYIRESDGNLLDDYKDAQMGGCMDAILEPIDIH